MLSDCKDRQAVHTGAFVFVVGPSGAGKDTVINSARTELAGNERFSFVRRGVTRPPGQWEAHDSLSPEEFTADEKQGCFSLVWDAHGLRYGIPATVADEVRRGRIAICNGSRAAIALAKAVFPNFRLVLITAPREVRMSRLSARGRETDIQGRLDRLEHQELTNVPDLVIENSSSIEISSQALVWFLLRLAERDNCTPSV